MSFRKADHMIVVLHLSFGRELARSKVSQRNHLYRLQELLVGVESDRKKSPERKDLKRVTGYH